MRSLILSLLVLRGALAQDAISGPLPRAVAPVPIVEASPAPSFNTEPVAPIVQPDRFSVAFSHQPLATFKAAFLTRVDNIALYQAMVCNMTNDSQDISGGIVLQQVFPDKSNKRPGVEIIDRSLVAATVNSAKSQSFLGKAASFSSWVAFGTSILFGSGLVGGSDFTKRAVQVSGTLITSGAERVNAQYDKSGADFSLLTWMDAGTQFKLAGSACSAGVFLGSWNRDWQPFRLTLP